MEWSADPLQADGFVESTAVGNSSNSITCDPRVSLQFPQVLYTSSTSSTNYNFIDYFALSNLVLMKDNVHTYDYVDEYLMLLANQY